MTGQAIADSLDALAERCGDPTPLVYARLFAARPELEALFVRDGSGMVRGQMLAMVIDILLDLTGPDAYASRTIDAERVNHQGLGVPPDLFDSFFATLMHTCRDTLGCAWTPAMQAAWDAVLARATARP